MSSVDDPRPPAAPAPAGADVVATLAAVRVVPVVVLDDAGTAPELGRALVAGGLPIAEVTFRTAAARDAIEAMAADPQLLVGAGTVVSATQVDQAVAAGARFVVSPGCSRAVVERCAEHGVPVLPGVATPTEIIAALDAGLELVKLFPAETLGGAATVKALAAPFPGLRFVPTGGIGPGNARDYLSLPAVLAIGGSWMVGAPLVRAGRFDEITRLAAEAVALAHEGR